MRVLAAVAAVAVMAGCAGPVASGTSTATAASDEWPDRFAGKDVATCTTPAGIAVRAATTRDDIEIVFPDGYSNAGIRFNVEAARWRFAVN